MDKFKALRVINILMGIFFLVIALSGIFHEVIPYEIYEKLHPLAGYLFVLLAVIHIKLNWSWIKTNILRPEKKK